MSAPSEARTCTCHQKFTGCWSAGHRLSRRWLPFTSGAQCGGVPFDLLTGPWALLIMSLLVLGDSFLVVVPGEIAVTVLGAIASTSGSPPLWAVIGCAGAAAACGDIACYLVGRTVGIERWAWMRRPRVRAALDWAALRLDGGTASVLFTARFVPFARLAINLVAGASRIHPGRYIGLVTTAALGWAAYQASVGAVVAAVIPGGPVVAVVVSVAVALGLGAAIDLAVRRARRRSSASTRPPRSDVA